jgi:UDP-N-acetylglucosamine diphosphorylase/glucosamine-1-phosphate N-acetyltransferase
MKVYVFEDTKYEKFLPLVYFRPVFDLKCGALSLKEKIEKYTGSKISHLLCRKELSSLLKEIYPKKKTNELSSDFSLFINGRVIADSSFIKQLRFDKKKDKLFIKDDSIVAAYLKPVTIEKLRERWDNNSINISDILKSVASEEDIQMQDTDVRITDYTWDLIKFNGEEIRNDFLLISKEMKGKKLLGSIHRGAHLLNKKDIIIDRESEVGPGVVLDATHGQIIIGMNVNVMAHAVIIGPAFIGDNTIVRVGAKIYSNTSIGEVCKVGGEVDSSIIHSYSNKQHDGYLGHAYLGSWVNIGADTNNSDLKNNYSNVKVYLNGKLTDTGMQHFGMLMGGHSKTGINMMFDTGTIIGVACNLYGSGLPPRFVPSFVRGSITAPLKTHSIEMALETAKIVMSRRDVQINKSYEELFRKTFELTAANRKREKII